MEPISILIPTYNQPNYLRLCLESIRQNQTNKDNEIVIVVDGTLEINKDTIDSFKDLNIKLVTFSQNNGFNIATNYCFYNASNKLCLNINDDNVLPKDFDKILISNYKRGSLLVPNQIEPRPSMFKQFINFNMGETVDEFDLNEFTQKEQHFRTNIITENGWTFPLFIDKYDFLKVGGMNTFYPGSNMSDWDLFLKLELCGIKSYRTHFCNFYHFGSISTKTPLKLEQEKQAHEYFKYMWGQNAHHNTITNSKLIKI